MEGIAFHSTDNPYLIAYSKATKDFSDRVLVVVNLDPVNPQAGFVTLDLAGLGLADGASFELHDLLTDNRFAWTGRGIMWSCVRRSCRRIFLRFSGETQA